MAESTSILTASIDDYLIALADGVSRAQRQLARVSIDVQAGQPALSYQLPRVDFEFKMVFELGSAAQAADLTEGKAIRKQLQVRPINAGAARASASIASTISGSLVAVPAEGGRPPPVVKSSYLKMGDRSFELRVSVQTLTGEPIPGVEVEFNVDRELTRQLNTVQDAGFSALASGTRLWFGEVSTKQNGRANNVLEFDQAEAPTLVVAVQIDVLKQRETILFSLG